MLSATFMCAVKGSEGDHKESSRVFPSIDQVREGPLGVAITAQALDEPEPGRKTLDHCTDPVGVGITNISTCRGTQTHRFAVELVWPCRMTFIATVVILDRPNVQFNVYDRPPPELLIRPLCFVQSSSKL